MLTLLWVFMVYVYLFRFNTNNKTQTTMKREQMIARIVRHGEELNAIFNTGLEPYDLCSRLRTHEVHASRITERLCECVTKSEEVVLNGQLDSIRHKVKKLLFRNCDNERLNGAFFINRDPRGYALKLRDDVARDLSIYRDMGGYSILAPDFS